MKMGVHYKIASYIHCKFWAKVKWVPEWKMYVFCPACPSIQAVTPTLIKRFGPNLADWCGSQIDCHSSPLSLSKVNHRRSMLVGLSVPALTPKLSSRFRRNLVGRTSLASSCADLKIFAIATTVAKQPKNTKYPMDLQPLQVERWYLACE